MAFTNSVSTSTVFIDLATFSEPEGFIYGGPKAITWFVRGVQKSNWFSFIPVVLRNDGVHDFGAQNSSVSVNRSGDYVLNVWFRAQIPQVYLNIKAQDPAVAIDNRSRIAWTRNLMHNLFAHISITFNELTVQEFDNYFLDANARFGLPASKWTGYNNMIGDIAAMTDFVMGGDPSSTPGAGSLPVNLGTGGFFQVPLPFWFTLDSGVALPIAALPFNDVKINYTFRRWQELIILESRQSTQDLPAGTVDLPLPSLNDVFIANTSNQQPALVRPGTWVHYAVVHNDERVKMGDAPRDMLIKQTQTIGRRAFNDLTAITSQDLRLSHSIYSFYFMAQNVSVLSLGDAGGEWSNYSTEAPLCGVVSLGIDPLAQASLKYESTLRVVLGSDYYSLTVPYYYSVAIPEEVGYHMYSYALNSFLYNPSGSTNYSKLANVSLDYVPSLAAINAAGVSSSGAVTPTRSDGSVLQWYQKGVAPDPLDPEGSKGADFPQSFVGIFIANNWNIARVANGSLGHPTL